MDGKRTADAADRSRDSRTNVDEDTDGSKLKPEGAPRLDLFAEDHEPGGYYNPLPSNMPAEAAEAQKVLFGDGGGAGGSSSSAGPAAGPDPAKKPRVEEPPREPPKMPALLELSKLIHVNAGSLGGAYLEHTQEAQAAGMNELIRSDMPDKGTSLLGLLSVEGIYVWAKGDQPPPLLTLVKVPEFVGLLDVWKRLIDLGADPTEEFQSETAAMVAEQTKSAVRLCLA